MKKSILSIILALAMCLSLCVPAMAAEIYSEDICLLADSSSEEFKPNGMTDYYYRKANVTTTYGWGPWKRVSDNLTASSSGGTLSCTEVVSESFSFSGEISGLTFSGERTRSSEIGYSLNVDANRTAYMQWRCHFRYETGIREKVSYTTGHVVARNEFSVTIPEYGNYALKYC